MLEQPLQPAAADQAGPADVEVEKAHDAPLGERACEASSSSSLPAV